jgi:predicted nucleic acid-binding protein
MRAFIDTNVLLDVLLPREPWAAESKAVWDAADAGTFDAVVSAMTLPNVFYIARKIIGIEKAREAVVLLLEAFEVVSLDVLAIEAALALPGIDFEDNLQLASAMAAQADLVVTRDPKGFAAARLPVLDPTRFLNHLTGGGNP